MALQGGADVRASPPATSAFGNWIAVLGPKRDALANEAVDWYRAVSDVAPGALKKSSKKRHVARPRHTRAGRC